MLFFSFGSIFSQINDPIIITKIDTTTIKVGEQISYEIKIESNDIGDVFFPEKYQFSPFVIAEEFPLDTIDFQRKKSITKRFRLTNFDEGNFVIKPQEIIFGNKKLYSDSLLIEVLTVEVTSEHKDGPVLLAVYDKQEYFGKTKANQKANPKHILLGAKGLISNYKGKVTFDLPYGNYVIAGIHDLDNNGVLTGNFLGMPKEPFGLSLIHI